MRTHTLVPDVLVSRRPLAARGVMTSKHVANTRPNHASMCLIFNMVAAGLVCSIGCPSLAVWETRELDIAGCSICCSRETFRSVFAVVDDGAISPSSDIDWRQKPLRAITVETSFSCALHTGLRLAVSPGCASGCSLRMIACARAGA